MSHVLPHLPQNTSARSLSPTSPVFRPYSPSLSCLVSAHSGLECETLRDPRRSGGYTKSASPTGYEPKLTQSGDFGPRQEYRDRSVPNTRKNSGRWLAKSFHRRYGGDWKFWCRHALRPIKETLRLRFSRKHCRNQKQNKTQVQIVLKPTTLKERERERERAWSQIHLKIHERLGIRMQCFHQEATNREIRSKVLCSNMLIRQNCEDLFLMVVKITCSVRRDLNLWDKNIKLDLSIAVSMSFSSATGSYSRIGIARRSFRGFLNLEENKFVYKKNYLWRKRFSETIRLEVFTKWEVKRAQELRVDDSSVQKLRESYETIQRLTSQMQEMQEQMNSMNDSREFQEVESNHSGRLSHVPSQPPSIPSSRSFLSRDKRLPPDTWNTSGPLENVFGNKFSTFDSSQKHHQGIPMYDTKRDRNSSTSNGNRGLFRKSELREQFQCRCLQEGRRPLVHYFRSIFRRTPRLDSKNCKYRNCHSTNSLHLLHSYVGR